MNNPYVVGKPVLEPEDFYGRVHELKDILSNIKILNPISLVGERGVGCTSLLRYITHPKIVEEYLDLEHFKLLYLDFAEFSQCTQKQFWGEILDKINKTKEELRKSSVINFLGKKSACIADLYEYVDKISNNNIKLVFCFDGFDKVKRNTNFDRYFFDNLRHFITAYSNVTFVTANKRNLGELDLPRDVLTSPFFTYFTHKRIGFLKEEETRDLILKPAKKQEMVFNEEDVDFVFDIAYCHPFFVQSVCRELFKCRLEKKKMSGEKLEQTDYKRIEKMLYQDFEVHFSYYWKSLNHDEKKKLKDICGVHENTHEEDFAMKRLRHFCLLKERGGRVEPFSSLLRRFCDLQRIHRDPFGD
jgi:hypothetical protein